MNVYCFLPKLEEWRDIPEYKGFYMVSDYGRVKSLERQVLKWDGFRVVKERIRVAGLKKDGYLDLNLSKDGKLKTIKIHVLVAIAFLNHIPNRHKIIVDHIDGYKLNNCLDNLQLITQRENASKDRKGGTSKYIGVCWDKRKNKWCSSIHVNGKQKYLGCFDNELEAANSYKIALKQVNN